jgi:membrane protease YdiL (CAAX protease family)
VQSRLKPTRNTAVYALLVLAFILPVLGSVLIVTGVVQAKPATPLKTTAQIVQELVSLAALFVILKRQKRYLRAIGFQIDPGVRDIGHSVLLFVAAFVANYVVYAIVVMIWFAATGHAPSVWRNASVVFGNAGVLFVVLVLINPFFEELLVRAYLITEVERIKDTRTAIVVSIVLQSSYHLYQGIPSALGLAGCFTLFSVYFVRTRRALPLILAHLYLDVVALLAYTHASH